MKLEIVRYMKRTVISIIPILFILNAFSQTVIKGKVTQQQGEVLQGANAYLQGTYDGTSCGTNGEFSFKTTKTGQATLLVEFIGYEPFSQKLELKGDTIRLNIRLKEAFNQLNAVTTTAGTFEASDKKQAVTITPLDMMTTAGAAGDVYGALQSLPGIKRFKRFKTVLNNRHTSIHFQLWNKHPAVP